MRLFVSTLHLQRSDVDETLQDAWLVAWKKLDSFRYSAEQPDEEFVRWLCTIARIEVNKYRRKNATGLLLDDEVIEDMKKHGTFLVPTLVAPLWVLRNAEKAPGSVLPQAIRKTKEVMEDHKASAARAIAAGVRVAMGTDSGVGPHGYNAEELQRMVECGMTPMQAIVATTKTMRPSRPLNRSFANA